MGHTLYRRQYPYFKAVVMPQTLSCWQSHHHNGCIGPSLLGTVTSPAVRLTPGIRCAHIGRTGDRQNQEALFPDGPAGGRRASWDPGRRPVQRTCRVEKVGVPQEFCCCCVTAGPIRGKAKSPASLSLQGEAGPFSLAVTVGFETSPAPSLA